MASDSDGSRLQGALYSLLQCCEGTYSCPNQKFAVHESGLYGYRLCPQHMQVSHDVGWFSPSILMGPFQYPCKYFPRTILQSGHWCTTSWQDGKQQAISMQGKNKDIKNIEIPMMQLTNFIFVIVLISFEQLGQVMFSLSLPKYWPSEKNIISWFNNPIGKMKCYFSLPFLWGGRRFRNLFSISEEVLLSSLL